MTETAKLSSKDFDQFEINRIIHLEQIPGYQLLKWERDYIKNYRKALKSEIAANSDGGGVGGTMFDGIEDTETSKKAKTEKKKTKNKSAK